MRAMINVVFVAVAVMAAACNKGSGISPSALEPGVLSPGPPSNIPPGTVVSSVTEGYFTIKDVTLDPGPGSVLKVLPDGSPRTHKVIYTVCISASAPDPIGTGFYSLYAPSNSAGEQYDTMIFKGGSDSRNPMMAGECRTIGTGDGAALIHSGSNIPPVIEKIKFYMWVGQCGPVDKCASALFSPDGTVEHVLADANYRRGG
ncbi:MAG: hypothetical protein Q8P83_00120 [bacterium]|nr:hypothetical protein [bacterium]